MPLPSTEGLQVKISNRQIFSIALPIAAAILVPQINFITNNIFLGQLGERQMGIAGITGVYYLIFAVIGLGLNNGLQALISRRAGENRPDDIGRLFGQGVVIALAFSALAILISYTVGPVLLRMAIHNDENYNLAIKFLKIRIWGLPFLYLYQMRNALLVGTNNSRFLIAGTVAETVTNIVLDYGLVFGHLGLPNLGFEGAALASIIAEATGMVVVYVVIHVKGISKQFQLFNTWTFDRQSSKLLLVQSLPLIAQHSISIITWEFFYLLIEHHGTRDLAISNAMRNVFGLFGCFAWAFASTTNTMVSNIIGQGLQHRVLELVWKISRLSVGFAISVCLIINFFPHLFLSIYGLGDDFINYGMPVLRIVSAALILQSLSVVWLNAVTATGNTKINLGIELVAIVLYTTYVWVVLEKWNLSIIWGWGSEWLYWTSTFAMSSLYLIKGNWRSKKV